MATATRRLVQAWRPCSHLLASSLPSSSSSTRHRRLLHTSPPRNEQHLLWSGTLLDKTSPTHTPLDLDLLLAAGGGDDVVDISAGGVGGVTLLGAPAASPTQGHALLCYRTIETDTRDDAVEEETALSRQQEQRGGLSRVLAIGRNTHAQLGCGFASHEATFGLVRPGFSGAGGIVGTAAGPAQSWLLTADEQGGRARNAFACGNNTQGQLGLPSEAPSSSSSQPQLQLIPAPRAVPVSQPSPDNDSSSGTATHDDASWSIGDLSVGLDHALLVRSRRLASKGKGALIEAQVCTTGLNTDGQLGRPLAASHPSSSAPQEWRDFGFVPVLTLRFDVDQGHDKAHTSPPLRATAGGDACLAWTTTGSGAPRVWAWGNNEYEQCLVTGADSEDQVARPTEVTEQVRRSLGEGGDVGIKDIKVGGSWTAMLDDTGALHMAGYGPVAASAPSSSSPSFAPLHKVTHTDEDGPIPPLATISASLDSLIAISACRRRLFACGIDRRSGNDDEGSSVLGLLADNGEQEGNDGREHLGRFTRPREVTSPSLARWLGGPRGRIEAASVGGEQSWVLIEDGEEPKGVWRGSSGSSSGSSTR